MNANRAERKAEAIQSRPARSPLERAVDLATAFAEDDGWYGEYAISRQQEAIEWRAPQAQDTAAYLVDGDPIMRTTQIAGHEQLALAIQLTAGVELEVSG